jgi:very-short-patch-repair endonuclease
VRWLPNEVARRRELLRFGASDDLIRVAMLDGHLRRVCHGWYSDPGLPSAETYVAAFRGGHLSHATARAMWGLPGPSEATLIHRTVPRGPGARKHTGERIHRVELAPADCTMRLGLPITSPERTVVDEARRLPWPWGVAVADAALHQGLVTRGHLVGALERSPRGPGIGQARRAIELSDGRAESALESLARVPLVCGGLEPRLQVEIGQFRVDLLIDELVIECDGFAHHSSRESYRGDRRRLNWLACQGFTVLRFSWEDVVGDPGGMVATVRAALNMLARRPA